jgi:hypothetical protein
MSEVQKFFDSLPKNENDAPADIFGEGKPKEAAVAAPAAVPAKEGELDANGEPRKNRRHRRLEQALEAERASSIALNDRLMKVLEAKSAPSSPDAMPAEWIALYGDSPEAQKAWNVQAKLLESHGERVRQETIKEIEARQSKAREEQKQFESFIDTKLEDLEDQFGVDLTSNAPTAKKARREFLEMVDSLSPKDQNGTITGYADFGSTFELYQKTSTKTPAANETVNRAKELASKSMQASGQGAPAETQKYTPGFRGWMKDYGVDQN